MTRRLQAGLPILVGAAVALTAVFLIWSIESLEHLWLGDQAKWRPGIWVFLLPAAGGLIVGPLFAWLCREAKGHGVPEVMISVSREGGRIERRVSVVKTAASIVTIGSGGSAGPEGPIVHVGSALASTFGQTFKVPAENLRLLVACGAAAGISATFNAPIAGALFASEVILREFNVPSFTSVVLSSVTATAVSRAILGDHPTFTIPEYAIVSPVELGFYAVLGILCALASVLFIRMVYLVEDGFERLRPIPAWLRPAIGGLLVGLIGLWNAGIYGSGYTVIDSTLNSGLLLQALLALFALKLIATSLTVGSGGSGGVFAPALFVGAMLGGAFGLIMQGVFPAVTARPGAYATVGMGALFAGTAHAPITAILMIFEMTQDYKIVLPLMIAVVISTVAARRLFPHSIYTFKLHRGGMDLDELRRINLLDLVTVDQAMARKFTSVPPEMPILDLVAKLKADDRTGYPVVDAKGQLVGIVTFRDVSRVLENPAGKTVADICTRSLTVVYPDETLSQAMLKLAVRDVARAPVMDRDDPSKLVGILERRDIINAAARSAREHEKHLRMVQEVQKLERDVRTLEVEVTPGSPVASKRVRDIELPADVLLVAIRRGRKIVVPRGATVLRAGDRVSILVSRALEAQVKEYAKKNQLQVTSSGTARF
ncbi:MAG TPA: chloride channel protein [Planctomycetota bacterium]|nr:chloride channel protein [Planctomycetota bacterium]